MFRYFLTLTLAISVAFTFEAYASQPSEIWNRIFNKGKVAKVKKPATAIEEKSEPKVDSGKGVPTNNIFLNNAEKGVVVLVDKSARKLHLYDIDGSSAKQIYTFNALFGKNNGNKVAQGDKKTPEGIYYITSFKSVDELKAMYGREGNIYGSGAFPISYPNAVDRLNSKTGGGIWIHGIGEDNKTVTRGCVALENNDLDTLKKYVSINTPVIIVDRFIETLPVDSKTFLTAITNLKSDYLKRNKISKVYSDDNFKIFIQNDTNFVVDFNILACKNNMLANENVKLYVVADDKDLYENIQDSYMVVTDEVKKLSSSNDIILSSVKTFVNDWINAWGNQDIRTYSAFYSKDFNYYGLSYDDYISNKSKLFGEQGRIGIDLHDIKYRIDGNQIYVTARQNYSSNQLNSKGVKSLTVVGCPNDYKIIHESWSSR